MLSVVYDIANKYYKAKTSAVVYVMAKDRYKAKTKPTIHVLIMLNKYFNTKRLVIKKSRGRWALKNNRETCESTSCTDHNKKPSTSHNSYTRLLLQIFLFVWCHLRSITGNFLRCSSLVGEILMCETTVLQPCGLDQPPANRSAGKHALIPSISKCTAWSVKWQAAV